MSEPIEVPDLESQVEVDPYAHDYVTPYHYDMLRADMTAMHKSLRALAARVVELEAELAAR